MTAYPGGHFLNDWHGAVGCILLAAILVLAGCEHSTASVHLAEDALVVRSAYFDERIALDTIDLDAARIVSVTKGSPYYPDKRGVGNSATRQGIYTLTNGARALSLVNGGSAYYIPAGRRRVLLISVADYPTLLEELAEAQREVRHAASKK